MQQAKVTDSFTIETVVKAYTVSARRQVIFGNPATSGISVEINGDELGVWSYHDGVSWKGVTTKMEAGVYYHVAGSYDGTALHFYLNGSEIGSEAVTAPVSHKDGDFYIGSDSWGDSGFEGSVYCARLYSKAVSSDEVYALYRAYRDEVAPAVMTSDTYLLDAVNGQEILRGIAPGTTVDELLAHMDGGGGTFIVFGRDGASVTSGPVGGGMDIALIKNGIIREDRLIVLYGDINGDGSINVLDMMAVKRHILKREIIAYGILADTDRDGEINVLDMMAVKRHILGQTPIAQS